MLRNTFNHLLLVLVLLLLFTVESMAVPPSQFGDTGLISQPVAQTLNEGNICLGIWTNCSSGVDNGTGKDGNSVIVPTTLTMV
ncbi:MAG: hypothetical protein OET90_03545 [Desulfuromonadales bacterium]|nr:hypothetical protein [Desulfuromonadales bacterium]